MTALALFNLIGIVYLAWSICAVWTVLEYRGGVSIPTILLGQSDLLVSIVIAGFLGTVLFLTSEAAKRVRFNSPLL